MFISRKNSLIFSILLFISSRNFMISWVDNEKKFIASSPELRVRLAHCETGSSPPVKYFYWPFQGGASFVDHLTYFCLVFVMFSCASVDWCLSHLLEWANLLARLWCLSVKLLLSHWHPGSGVVFGYIDSWSLPSFLRFVTWGRFF